MDIEGTHRGIGTARTYTTSAVFLLLAVTIPLFAQPAGKPTESKHVSGPHGLEGWTLDSPVPESNYGDEPFSFTLVIARNGKVLHRIKGAPIIWKWMFRADGAQVAYETGPFHFSMMCVLTEVKTGRTLQTFDCYHGLPENAPGWVTALHPDQGRLARMLNADSPGGLLEPVIERISLRRASALAVDAFQAFCSRTGNDAPFRAQYAIFQRSRILQDE